MYFNSDLIVRATVDLKIVATAVLLVCLSGCMTTPAGIGADQNDVSTSIALGSVLMIAEAIQKILFYRSLAVQKS